MWGPWVPGKTTVGRQLAKTLGKEFYDCDREIEKTTGADIPLIFELEGEEGFRKREQGMLARLTETHQRRRGDRRRRRAGKREPSQLW